METCIVSSCTLYNTIWNGQTKLSYSSKTDYNNGNSNVSVKFILVLCFRYN